MYPDIFKVRKGKINIFSAVIMKNESIDDMRTH